MTIAAFAVAEAIADDGFASAQLRGCVAALALKRRMFALERIAGQRCMVEGLDLEAFVAMAGVAFAPRFAQAELSPMRTRMTACAIAAQSAIASASARFSILRGGLMTGDACRTCMRSEQWPGAMIDIRAVPPVDGMAVGAATRRHFGGELIAVGGFVAVVAAVGIEAPVESRAIALMAGATRDGLVAPAQLEGRRCMRLDAKERRREPLLVVALSAFATLSVGELAPMRVAMTIDAASEAEFAVALLWSELRLMATRALDLSVATLERERGFVVRLETDVAG